MKRTLPTLSLLLALWAIPGLAHAEEDGMEPPMTIEAFVNSQYDVCDAKLLANLWGESVEQAKLTISYKLTTGWEGQVKEGLVKAREKALQAGSPTCTIHEMGYKYEDAAALATTWGYTVTEAKAAMFNKYLNVGEEGLRDALRASNAPSVVNPGGATIDPAATQASRPLHYCDAKAVAAMWGTDMTTTKVALQRKMATNLEWYDEAVKDAHTRDGSPTCDWTDVKYGYEDAAYLAQIWGVTPEEAKGKIVSSITNGYGQQIHETLETRHMQ